MIGHLDRRLPAGLTRHLLRQPVKEGDLVGGPGVHEEEVRVPELDPTHGGPKEHALLAIDGHGHDPIAHLCEQSRESQQEGFAARGPLGAHHEVALLEELRDTGGVGGAVAGQGDGRDWREEPGELTDAVGDAGDFAAEGDGDDNGVEGGAVVADVEVAGGARGRRRRAVAPDDEPDAEEFVGVADNAFGKRKVEVDADDGEDEAEGEPEVDDDGIQWGGALHEPTVVEDDAALELVHWDWSCCFAGWHHVALLYWP